MASERDWKSDWLMVCYPRERKREVRALWGAAGTTGLTLDQAAASFREERDDNQISALWPSHGTDEIEEKAK